ncbi:MAG: hypothetical protein U0237_11270 [Thermoleophilia bacterium]
MSGGARTAGLRATAALAALVGIGVFVQVYLIASYIFGADALDAHKAVGGITHLVEVLTFIAALVGWWKDWKAVGLAFLLPLVGTVQVAFSDGEKWVGGLHGLLALFVLVLAAVIHVRAMRAARPGLAG